MYAYLEWISSLGGWYFWIALALWPLFYILVYWVAIHWAQFISWGNEDRVYCSILSFVLGMGWFFIVPLFVSAWVVSIPARALLPWLENLVDGDEK